MARHMNRALPLAHFTRMLGVDAPLARLLVHAGDDAVFVESFRATLEQQAANPGPDFDRAATYRSQIVAGKGRFVLTNYLLPFLGTAASDDEQKAYWLLRWTRELLECRAGKREYTDRDDLYYKRTRGPGQLMEDLFSSSLCLFRSKLAMLMRKSGQKVGVERVDVLAQFARSRNCITQNVCKALSTGNKGKGRVGFTRQYELFKSRMSAISDPMRDNMYLGREAQHLDARYAPPRPAR